MPETDIKDKLISYISDAVALEQNVEQMLGGMISTTEDGAMRGRLEQHRDETKQQIERLRGRLDANGASESAMKNMAAKAGAAMKGVMDMGRGDKAGKNARDGYATEHMEIASYELLKRVAERAGDTETAAACDEILAQERAMAEAIAASWDRVVELGLTGSTTAGSTAPENATAAG
jgi:ferritin-like metal-binding protein YciE